jgi:hypothetical protein
MYVQESVSIQSVFYCSRYFAAVRDKWMYGQACMQSLSAFISCIRPLGHGNRHHVPKTPSCDFTPGWTHSARQGIRWHVPIRFILTCPPTRICTHPSLHMRPGPLWASACAAGWASACAPCALLPCRSCLKPCHSPSGMVARPGPNPQGPHHRTRMRTRMWTLGSPRRPPLPPGPDSLEPARPLEWRVDRLQGLSGEIRVAISNAAGAWRPSAES